jgi:hypothetical protein
VRPLQNVQFSKVSKYQVAGANPIESLSIRLNGFKKFLKTTGALAT